MITDLLGMVLMLVLMGLFAMFVMPVALLLLRLNRKLLEDHRPRLRQGAYSATYRRRRSI